eukprot:scaffold2502_cov51-Phaeocystis_antarctica.AAC.2
MREHPPRTPCIRTSQRSLPRAYDRPTRAGSGGRVAPARGAAAPAGRGASVHEEGVRNARGGS